MHGHHQMANIEIRLIIFFAAKDGEALYSQQKLDWELTVAHIMTNLESILNNRDIILSIKICLVKAIVFSSSPVWM